MKSAGIIRMGVGFRKYGIVKITCVITVDSNQRNAADIFAARW